MTKIQMTITRKIGLTHVKKVKQFENNVDFELWRNYAMTHVNGPITSLCPNFINELRLETDSSRYILW